MRGMQNNKRKLSQEQAMDILNNGHFGVLSTVCDDGLPYGVPLNYVTDGAYTLYFHGAKTGQKIDNIRHNNRVCLTVVPTASVDAPHQTMQYESVMVFGTAAVVTGETEKRRALAKLMERFSPMSIKETTAYIDRFIDETAVIRMEIEYISGKANR